MRMNEIEGIAEYITQVEIVINQLSRNGETLLVNRVLKKILRFLIDDFVNMVCAIEESNDLSNLTIEEFVDSFKVYDKRKKKKA